MPVYNAGSVLQQAIRSVLSQTYKDWKLWIVDDGSTELTTKAILNMYEMMSNPKISVVHQENGGPSSARNKALSLIKPDSIVAYCDADDFWGVEHLERAMIWINEGYDFVYSNPQLISEVGNIMYANFQLYETYEWRHLKDGNFIFTPTVVHKNGLGFFRSEFDGLEDYEYWIRAAKTYMIKQDDRETTFCTVREHGVNNMSSKGTANILAKIHEEHAEFFKRS